MKPLILSVSRSVLCKTNYTSRYLLPPPPPLSILIHFLENMHSTDISGTYLGIINNNDGLDLHSAFQHSKYFTLKPFVTHIHTHTHTGRCGSGQLHM